MIIDNKIDLIVESVGNNQVIIKEIKNITNDYYELFLNNKQLQPNQTIQLKEFLQLELVKILGEEQDVHLFKLKKSDLIKFDNKQYYQKKILINNLKKIEFDQELITTYFNEEPLFFKFMIELKNFDFKKFKIIDELGNELKFRYLDYKQNQIIYFAPKLNNKYFWIYENKKEQIKYYPSTKSLFKTMNLQFITNHYIKWFYLKSNQELEVKLLINYTNGSEIKTLKTITNEKQIRDNQCIFLNKLVTSIKLLTLTQSEVLIKLNYEDNLYSELNKKYWLKNKITDFSFQCNLIEEYQLTKQQIEQLEFNKKYYLLNQELFESNFGYIYLKQLDKNDFFKIESFWLNENKKQIKYDQIQFTPKEYYLNNFSSINTLYKGAK